MSIAFVTNICPHYRIQTFEKLANGNDIDFYFYSAGDEWYWQMEHGVQHGPFNYEYLSGISLGGTRITPGLLWHLWRKPYQVFIKCINGRFALPMTFLVSRLKRKPFILWTGVWMRLQTPFHRAIFPLTRYIYSHADAVVVYGEHVKRYLQEEGVPVERIFVASHAANNANYNRIVSEKEKTELREQLQIAPEEKIVLFLGRLEIVKGLSYLIDAFANMNRDDSVLVLAGTGSLEFALKQLVQNLGISNKVRFPGYVRADKAICYYSIASVYVLPSITTATFKEPWGLVINEAFNQGTPVVATDSVGAAAGGLILHGKNGFVVPEQKSVALQEKIVEILDNPQMREKMSLAAQNRIAEWNNEKMVQGFNQAITYVLKSMKD